jgi:hypothetical protein
MSLLNDLSPEAARAVRESAARHRLYARAHRVTLARNATRAIIIRPSWDGKQHQREVADWIKANLPNYTFRSERNWWEGPLELLPDTYEKLKQHDMVTLSDGAQRYLEEVGTDDRTDD